MCAFERVDRRRRWVQRGNLLILHHFVVSKHPIMVLVAVPMFLLFFHHGTFSSAFAKKSLYQQHHHHHTFTYQPQQPQHHRHRREPLLRMRQGDGPLSSVDLLLSPRRCYNAIQRGGSNSSNKARKSSSSSSTSIRMSTWTVDNDNDDDRSLKTKNDREAGGDVLSSSTNTARHNRTSTTTTYQQRGMTLALASCYFTVMGAKCALPSTLSLLLSPRIGLTFDVTATTTLSSSPQQLMARQLSLSTLAIALGKLLLGPIIDHLGGQRSLQIALGCLMSLLLTISMCQSFTVFGWAWVLVDFIFSSCWAACINTIHQYFSPTDWPQQIGYLATAARAGNSVAFMLFALILNYFQQSTVMNQYWRPVFFVAAVSQCIPLLLLSYFGSSSTRAVQQSTTGTIPNNRRVPESKPVASISTKKHSISAPLATLRREAATIDFWLHMMSRSSLMVYASFLLFVPTYMTQVHHTTASTGSQVGSLYALGCLLSVTTMSKGFAKLPRRAKLLAVTALLLLGATGSSLAQLAHVCGLVQLSPSMSATLLLLWGFSFAIPFYIPPSLYALSRGGKESSATIADVFDVGGFALLAMFNGYVASIAHDQPSAWITTFVITSSCSLVSFVALALAVWREEKS